MGFSVWLRKAPHDVPRCSHVNKLDGGFLQMKLREAWGRDGRESN